ncbi:phosphoribosyltransferase [Amycolatopsis sp. NPDC058986]|uniref:phosphoribosyltransferase n=1 Tax=unclassified Amycolatopsis TaxID=2618356 RepID=UPI00366FB375
MIGIANGGTAPAREIAAVLGLEAYLVLAKHNLSSDAYQQATGVVHLELGSLVRELNGGHLEGHVLLVDDICGSGATLRCMRRGLAELLASNARVHTATLCLNTGAATKPDYSVWTVSDWVVFPWESTTSGTAESLPIPSEVTYHA